MSPSTGGSGSRRGATSDPRGGATTRCVPSTCVCQAISLCLLARRILFRPRHACLPKGTQSLDGRAPRSQDTLHLDAGCPSSGRLSTLDALSLSTLTWSTLPPGPGPARGGRVLTALPALAHYPRSRLLARSGGFAGHELGGLDVYDVHAREWTNVEVDPASGEEKPPKRSVHAFVGLGEELDLRDGRGGRVVAVLTMGERDPAPQELGHDGAGFACFFFSHSPLAPAFPSA